MDSIQDALFMNSDSLASAAAYAAEGLMFYEYLGNLHEWDKLIKDGLAVCNFLASGHEVVQKFNNPGYTPFLGAFQNIPEDASVREINLTKYANEACAIRDGLKSLLDGQPIDNSTLRVYRSFFRNITVSLGL